MSNGPLQKIAPDVVVGEEVRIYDFVNLYGCTIGDRTKVGTFVEVQKGVKIGADCKVSSIPSSAKEWKSRTVSSSDTVSVLSTI